MLLDRQFPRLLDRLIEKVLQDDGRRRRVEPTFPLPPVALPHGEPGLRLDAGQPFVLQPHRYRRQSAQRLGEGQGARSLLMRRSAQRPRHTDNDQREPIRLRSGLGRHDRDGGRPIPQRSP